MFPKFKVTEIYCMADDFCKEFSLQQAKYMIEDKMVRHHNKPNRMSDAEIIPNRSLDFMVDFVLLSGRLISVFVEDVAGYIEKKQEARCRQQCGKRLKSQLKLTVDSLTLFGGLMTDLG